MWIFKFFRYHFDIIEEGFILFLQIAVMFGMNNNYKTKNETKRKHQVPEFFLQTIGKEIIQQFSKK